MKVAKSRHIGFLEYRLIIEINSHIQNLCKDGILIIISKDSTRRGQSEIMDNSIVYVIFTIGLRSSTSLESYRSLLNHLKGRSRVPTELLSFFPDFTIFLPGGAISSISGVFKFHHAL